MAEGTLAASAFPDEIASGNVVAAGAGDGRVRDVTVRV